MNVLLRRSFLAIFLQIGGVAPHGNAAVASADCQRSVVSVAASIEFISPADGTLVVRHGTDAPRRLGVGACLTPGDVILVPPEVQLAKIFTSDTFISLHVGDRPYTIEGGIGRVTSAALAFLTSLTTALVDNPTPEVPSATASRSLKARPIQALATAVPQRIPLDAGIKSLVLAWHGPSYGAHCSLLAPTGRALAESPNSDARWCSVSLPDGNLSPDTLLTVAAGESAEVLLSWPIIEVASSETPRPSWLSDGDISSSERALWGLWLLREAPAEWRVAGLSMLYTERTKSWLAARAYRQVLAETPGLLQ